MNDDKSKLITKSYITDYKNGMIQEDLDKNIVTQILHIILK